MLHFRRSRRSRFHSTSNRISFEPLEPRVLMARDVELSSYIVMLDDDAGDPAAEAAQIAKEVGSKVGHVYQHAFKGFSLELHGGAVEGLKKNPKVRSLESDGIAQLLAQTLPPGINRVEADVNHLAKIDGIDDPFGVNIAIIDTGISLTHPDLRVVGGVNFVPKGTNTYNDGHGHGSHVAGIAAAVDNGNGVVGVAPGARLWAVRVLDNQGGGTLSQAIAGMDWVLGTRLDADPANDIHVANMSFGFTTIGDAGVEMLQAMADSGIILVAAAGNNSSSFLSPFQIAGHPAVMAVSATVDTDGQAGGLGASTADGADDTFASFTNWSNKVEIAAPGSQVFSTYKGTGYQTMSGTSMAAPHVAGAMALLVARYGPANDALDTLLYRQIAVDSGQPQSEWRGGGSTGERGTRAEPLVQATGNWVTSPLGRIQSHVALQLVEGIQTVAIAARDLNSAAGALQVSVQAGGGEPMPAVYNPATGLYEAIWDTTAHPDGDVILSATVTDDEGYTRAMPSVTVEVDNIDEVVEVVTFASSDVPKQFKNQQAITSTITVPESFSIYDLDVQLNVTQPLLSALAVSLRSPSGTSVVLKHFGVGSGANLTDTIFDDEAETYIGDGTAPFAGRYSPGVLLRAVDGQDAAGTWTLTVSQNAKGVQGTLNSWSIHFAREVASAAAMAMSVELPSAGDSASNSSTLLDAATVDRILAETEAQSTWSRKSRLRIYV